MFSLRSYVWMVKLYLVGWGVLSASISVSWDQLCCVEGAVGKSDQICLWKVCSWRDRSHTRRRQLKTPTDGGVSVVKLKRRRTNYFIYLFFIFFFNLKSKTGNWGLQEAFQNASNKSNSIILGASLFCLECPLIQSPSEIDDCSFNFRDLLTWFGLWSRERQNMEGFW